MNKRKKYNLVLTHSFPTNSIILSGFIEFLSEYFNVYFIDLPGFTKDTKPLKHISNNGYANYLQNEINKLNLGRYILGGLSFSFSVIERLKIDNKCRAVIAMEPYINKYSLNIPNNKIILYSLLCRTMILLKLQKILWKRRILGLFFKFSDKNILMTILKEIDPKTFVYTANLIFNYSGEHWLSKPHILIANKDDKRVLYTRNLKLFERNVKDLLVINITADHFPDTLTKEYFQNNISKEAINKMINWLDKRY